MEKAKDPEEVYLDALNDAFNSKTPAQHLADSKYMGRGLSDVARRRLFVQQNPEMHKLLSTPGLTVPQLVDAMVDCSSQLAKRRGTYVTVLLHVCANANAIVTRPGATADEVSAGMRLAARVGKKGSIQRVVVHKHVSPEAARSEISFPTVLF